MRPSVIDPKRPSSMQGASPYTHSQQGRSSMAPPSHIYPASHGISYPQRPVERARRPGLSLAPLEGWTPLLFLGVALYCVVMSIKEAHWVTRSDWLIWSPALGLLVGLLIAKLRGIAQGLLHMGACLLGYWFALALTSSIVYHIPMFQLLGGLHAVFTGSTTSLPTMLAEALFFFYLSFLNFFLGYFGSWLVYRARLPWLVVLIYCAILLVNLNYVKVDSTALVCVLAGALLLLVARIHLAAQVAQWMQDGLHTDRTWRRALVWRCMQITCVFTLCTLAVSWFMPFGKQTEEGRVFWDRLGNGWNNIVSGHIPWNNPASLFNGTAENFFDSKLMITGTVNLPTGQVLTYTSSNRQPQYLLGFTFNEFDGHTWTSTFDQSTPLFYSAGAGLPLDTGNPVNMDEQVETKVTVLQPPGGPRSYIFAPAQPIRFNVPVAVTYDVTANTWLQQKPLSKNETYTVVSVPLPESKELLQSVPLPSEDVYGEGYSSVWSSDDKYPILKGNYTSVTGKYSSRVQELAQQWVGDANDTYTALKRLEAHLSDASQFTYSISNPSIPANTNVVDWLLQNKRGYCTYYASAMVVMARMLHIPARMANGFSSGHYDTQRKQWVVMGDDAHSWVQAYLPNIGWVNFDPTPGFTGLVQKTADSEPTSTPTETPTENVSATPTVKSTVGQHPQVTPPTDTNVPGSGQTGGTGISDGLLLGVSLVALLISIIVFCVALVTYRWRNLYASSTFITGMYWRLCWLASKLGFAPNPWQTPFEYSDMLGKRVPTQSKPLWYLTELFVRDRWGPRNTNIQASDVNRVQPALRGFFWQLLTSRLRRKRR